MIGREAYRHGYDYVAQTEMHDMAVALDHFADDASRQQSFDYLAQAYAETDHSRLHDYLRAHVRFFLNVPDWVEYLRSKDFMMGTRLHGIVAGLLAGIPALLVTHDTRTEEAAHWLGISTIGARELLDAGCLDAQRLAERVDADAFNQRMIRYRADFAAFFRSNGVETVLSGM